MPKNLKDHVTTNPKKETSQIPLSNINAVAFSPITTRHKHCPNKKARQLPQPGLFVTQRSITSTAFAVAAGQAGGAAVHHDYGLGAALAAHGGVGGVLAGAVVVGGLVLAGLKLGAFFSEDALGGFAQLVAFQQADGFQVFLDHGADFGNQ